MKKISIFIVPLLAIIVLSGCGKKSENSIETNGKEEKRTSEVVSEKVGEMFDFSKPMECSYKMKDENGDVVESKVYVDGEKYKSEFSAKGIKNYSISDGKTMYVWSSESSDGTKMNMDCLEDLGGEAEEEITVEPEDGDYGNYETSQELLENAMEVDCKESSSVDLSVPKNINFVDQCEMLKKQMDAIKNMQNQMPSVEGVEIPQI